MERKRGHSAFCVVAVRSSSIAGQKAECPLFPLLSFNLDRTEVRDGAVKAVTDVSDALYRPRQFRIHRDSATLERHAAGREVYGHD